MHSIPMKYRLFCCSDTHGAGAPQIDVPLTAWLHAGDFYNGWRIREEAHTQADEPPPTPRDKSADGANWFPDSAVPGFAVRGNHDVSDPYGFFAAVQDVTGRVARIADGLWVAGIGWHGQFFFDVPTDQDLSPLCDRVRREALAKTRGSDRILLLTHYPAVADAGGVKPYGSVARLARDLRALAIIQGHLHEAFGRRRSLAFDSGEVVVLDPGPDGMVLVVEPDRGGVELEQPRP